MVPLEKNIKNIKESFYLLGFMDKDPFSKEYFEPYWDNYLHHCISTNEVVGLVLYRVKGFGFVYVPRLIKGHQLEDTLREELLYLVLKSKTIENLLSIGNLTAFGMRNFWKKSDFDQILALQESDDPFFIMEQALQIAYAIIDRSDRILGVVCGPMSSGKGSVTENLRVFIRTVYKIGQRQTIFNQLPFESLFHKVHQLIIGDKKFCPEGTSSMFFIKYFYEKIFTLPGVRWQAYFIDGYKHSIGAMAEYRIMHDTGHLIHELREGFSENIF